MLAADVGARVAFHGDREVHSAVDVVEHCFDLCAAALQEQVLGVGPPEPWSQEDAAAHAHGPSVHQDAVPGRVGGVVARRVPPRGVGPEYTAGVDQVHAVRDRVLRGGRGRVGSGDLPQGPYRAVQPLQDLGRHRLGQVDDGCRPRIGAACLALLLVGQGRRAQGEDLVDLGGVVERARALGGDGRMVLQDDRGRQHQVRAPGFPGEHRPGVQVTAGRDRTLGPFGRVRHRQERSRAETQQQVRGDQRPWERGVPVVLGGVGRPGGGVLHHGGEPHDPVGAVEFAGGQPHSTADLLAAADQAAHRPPVRVQDGFGLLAGGPGEGDRDSVPGQFGDVHDHFDAILGALVPRDQHPVGQVESVHGLERAVVEGLLHCPSLGVQEPCLDGEHGAWLRLHQALGVLEVVLLAVGAPAGRHEHPELPAQPVLGRGSPVRVQHIALEEHGVGDLPGGGEPGLQCGREQ